MEENLKVKKSKDKAWKINIKTEETLGVKNQSVNKVKVTA